ncbi:MAG TPA: hypothetical protein VHB25_10520 [Gemmatimonadaceae bacterium]|nr:hypothetical protein [Gemmatimonadaceae bacterium]
MADQTAAPDLRPLENTYRITGEVRGTDDARAFIARRTANGEEVLITVVRAPRGEGSNALNHYAADTKLLSGLSHPNMPRVFEGRWLGNDAFALVTERPRGETLGELLSRDERMSFPRIASVLQDVKGVLDWARDNGVVHRGVTVDSLVFERDSAQVLVSLLPTAIGIDAVPGACDDARTIGRLARTMITGEPLERDDLARPIAELRPDLSARVAEETDRMVACANAAEAPDVSAFIGVVAMADALKEGEDTVDHLKAEFAAEKQADRERFDAEMNACRQDAAEQAAAFAAEREEARRRIQENETQLAAERAQYDQERIEFDRACEELAQQRATFDEERSAFERERDAWIEERESLESRLAAAEQALAAERERAATAAAAAAEAAATATATSSAANAERERTAAEAVAVPVLTEAALKSAIEKDRASQKKSVTSKRHETVVPIETRAETRPVPLAPVIPAGAKWEKAPPAIKFGETPVDGAAAEEQGGRRWPWLAWRPSWTKPAAIVGAAVLLGGAIAIARHENSHTPVDSIALGGRRISPSTPVLDTASMPRGGFLTQSAGGSLAAHGPAVPYAARVDSSAGAAQSGAQISAGDVSPSAASQTAAPASSSAPDNSPTPMPNRAPARPLGPRAAAPPAAGTTTSTNAFASPAAPAPPLIDTTRHDSIIPLRLGIPNRDSLARRDSALPRRDTTVRRDTMPHDTSSFGADTTTASVRPQDGN